MPPVDQAPAVSFGNPIADDQCLRCHDGARVDAAIAAGRDKPTWDATLSRMVLYGAVLTPEDRDELGTWLAAQAP